jgi:hypothetical protein
LIDSGAESLKVLKIDSLLAEMKNKILGKYEFLDNPSRLQ